MPSVEKDVEQLLFLYSAVCKKFKLVQYRILLSKSKYPMTQWFYY